jgi:hypothetical protein
MITYWVFLGWLCLLSLWLGLSLWVERRYVKLLQADLHELEQFKEVASGELYEQQVSLLRHKSDLRAATLKLEASLSANGAFQTSRDQVWDLYRRSSIAAGNAQAWLFRELGSALQEVNQYRAAAGKPLRTAPPGLEDGLEAFRAEHLAEKVAP